MLQIDLEDDGLPAARSRAWVAPFVILLGVVAWLVWWPR
jgi:hypothetical protein